jgi:hypothetical protein
LDRFNPNRCRNGFGLKQTIRLADDYLISQDPMDTIMAFEGTKNPAAYDVVLQGFAQRIVKARAS